MVNTFWLKSFLSPEAMMPQKMDPRMAKKRPRKKMCSWIWACFLRSLREGLLGLKGVASSKKGSTGSSGLDSGGSKMTSVMLF